MSKTQSYTSHVNEKFLLTISKTAVFKIYFVDILNREQKNKYVWEYAEITKKDLLNGIEKLHPQGIGFIIAFPHVFKIFRFGPSIETNLYSIAYNPKTMERLTLQEEGWLELGCLAEIEISFDEFTFWATSPNVEDYLLNFSSKGNGSILDHSKLFNYTNSE